MKNIIMEHIAGIIGASHNGTEILGIVPKVKIIPLNIMSNEANRYYYRSN